VRSHSQAPRQLLMDGFARMPRVVPNPASVSTSRLVLGETIVSRIDWVDATGRVLGSVRDECGLTSSIPLSRFGVANPPRRSWLRLAGPWGSRGIPILVRS
jgi:hypothetical protein